MNVVICDKCCPSGDRAQPRDPIDATLCELCGAVGKAHVYELGRFLCWLFEQVRETRDDLAQLRDDLSG